MFPIGVFVVVACKNHERSKACGEHASPDEECKALPTEHKVQTAPKAEHQRVLHNDIEQTRLGCVLRVSIPKENDQDWAKKIQRKRGTVNPVEQFLPWRCCDVFCNGPCKHFVAFAFIQIADVGMVTVMVITHRVLRIASKGARNDANNFVYATRREVGQVTAVVLNPEEADRSAQEHYRR